MAILAGAVISRPFVSNFRGRIGSVAQARGHNLERSGRIYRARPWLVFANLLSAYDLARAISKSRIRAYVQVFSLVLGLVSSLLLSHTVGWQSWFALLAGVGISATDFALEVRGLREEDVGCVVLDRAGDVDRDGLLPAILADPGRLLSFRSSHALYDREINAALNAQSSPTAVSRTSIDWSNDSCPLPYRIVEWRRQILLDRYRHSRAGRPFNGNLVRQITSSDVIHRDPFTPVRMQSTRYFDLMCSNYLTESFVLDRRSRTRILDGVDLIRGDDGRLPTLESSALANAVGVSTLAFDSRNRLILIQQSEFAQSSRNLWSPSGSGSLEPADIDHSRLGLTSSVPLVDVVRRGMNRELVEESHIPEQAIFDSRVIAFFRWLNKGGKPEYLGVTLLNRPVTELRRRWSEFRWVRGIEVGVTVDFERLRADPASAHQCLGDDVAQREMFEISLSFPLYVALFALGEQLRDDPAFHDWLFSR